MKGNCNQSPPSPVISGISLHTPTERNMAAVFVGAWRWPRGVGEGWWVSLLGAELPVYHNSVDIIQQYIYLSHQPAKLGPINQATGCLIHLHGPRGNCLNICVDKSILSKSHDSIPLITEQFKSHQEFEMGTKI
jgi:hypothetical protein